MRTITTITIGTNPGTYPATTNDCGQCKLDAEYNVEHASCPHNWGPTDLGQDVEQWALDTTADCTSHYFEGFTLFPVTGYWQGNRERSVRLEITHNNGSRAQYDLAQLVQYIHRAFAAGGLPQDSILVQHQHVDTEFVERD